MVGGHEWADRRLPRQRRERLPRSMISESGRHAVGHGVFLASMEAPRPAQLGVALLNQIPYDWPSIFPKAGSPVTLLQVGTAHPDKQHNRSQQAD